MLKAGIAFLAWLLLSAVLLEAGNREPGPICTGLTGLLVQAGGKRVHLCQVGAGDVQVVVPNAAPIHPRAQTCGTRMNWTVRMAASMACGTGLIGSQLVLVDEHALPICGPLLQEYTDWLNILSSRMIPHLAGDGNTRGGGASSPFSRQGLSRTPLVTTLLRIVSILFLPAVVVVAVIAWFMGYGYICWQSMGSNGDLSGWEATRS